MINTINRVKKNLTTYSGANQELSLKKLSDTYRLKHNHKICFDVFFQDSKFEVTSLTILKIEHTTNV